MAGAAGNLRRQNAKVLFKVELEGRRAPLAPVGMKTYRRRAASVISLYASKAFNCASAICAAGKFQSSIAVLSLSRWRERFDSAGSAATFQTLSKPRTTIFKAYGNHFLGPGSIRCIVRQTDIGA
jgi:hypothetical protein